VELIDTHAHLYLPEFENDLSSIIENAQSNNIYKIIIPNIDELSLLPLKKLSISYPGVCYAAFGLHPTHVKENYNFQLNIIEKELTNNEFVAIGECGLDYYWDIKYKEQQIQVFREHLSWAKHFKKPIIIHSRNSMDDLLSILSESQYKDIKGVLHCFSGTKEHALQAINLGLFLGIGGVITYKNSELATFIKELPIEKIMLETDSPFLAPVPHRGKRNEPAFISLVANRVSELYGADIQYIANTTTQTAKDFFSI